MQWTLCLFQEAAVQRKYMSCALTRSVCEGMMNDRQGGSRGHAARASLT